ncbi:hypothetical protein J6590_055808 [Homalodisca vitripennis]|nr:hypothetical protein J6590_055808 [Homalodisca vitripennis]
MSAPGGGKSDADVFRSSGLKRTPPGSAPTTPVSDHPPAFPSLSAPLSRAGSSDSMASVSSKRQRGDEESAAGALEKRKALGVLELNTAKMSKAYVSTLRDTILELEREIAKQRADAAYLRGRVDERSSIQRFLSERDGGFSESLKSSVVEAIAKRAPTWSEVAKSSPFRQ